MISTGLNYISKSLIALHKLFTNVNNATGGWFVALLKVVSALITVYSVCQIAVIAFHRLNLAVVFLNSIGFLKPLIAGMMSFVRTIWAAYAAHMSLNKSILVESEKAQKVHKNKNLPVIFRCLKLQGFV